MGLQRREAEQSPRREWASLHAKRETRRVCPSAAGRVDGRRERARGEGEASLIMLTEKSFSDETVIRHLFGTHTHDDLFTSYSQLCPAVLISVRNEASRAATPSRPILLRPGDPTPSEQRVHQRLSLGFGGCGSCGILGADGPTDCVLYPLVSHSSRSIDFRDEHACEI